MKNLIRTALLTIALTAGGSLHAEWLHPERGLELDRTQLTLPQHATGNLTVRKCVACEPLELAVTPKTQYFAAPRTASVPLEQLRRTFYASTHDDSMIIGVFFDPETMTVNRLVLYPSW